MKRHTLLDRHGSIPAFIHISDGKIHKVDVLDHWMPDPGAGYFVDRGLSDFEQLSTFHGGGQRFLLREARRTRKRSAAALIWWLARPD